VRQALQKGTAAALLVFAAASWVLPGGVGLGSIRLGGTAMEVAPPLHRGTPWARFLAPEGTCRGDGNTSGPKAEQLFAMRCLLDWARTRRGLPPLRTDTALVTSSKLKAEAIVRCGDFSHTPCGAPFSETFDAAGWRGPAGENIVWGASLAASPRVLVDGWLHSDGHRENLFRLLWSAQGLAFVRVETFLGKGPASVWVHQFGG
jgi:hypothetical protein